MRKLWLGFMAALLLALLALPILASPEVQEGGGVHFGVYTLQPGNRVNGDLVVIGGPVELGAGSVLGGDLTVFGPFTMETDAVLEGQLVVMGSADVSCMVEGDLFTAGSLMLRETAYIEGDVAAAGSVDQAPGAVIEGEFAPMLRDVACPCWPQSHRLHGQGSPAIVILESEVSPEAILAHAQKPR